MRIPVGVDLESRDGTVAKDAKVLNGVLEQVSETEWRVRKRDGVSDLGSVRSGTPQMLAYFNGQIISVIGYNSDRTTLPLASNNIGTLATFTITITRAGSTATAQISGFTGGHGVAVGDSVTISGAVQTDYNGTFTVLTTPAATTFTYTVANAPVTPATGTITASLNTIRQWYSDDNGLAVTSTGYLVLAQPWGMWRIKDDWTLTRIVDSDLSPFTIGPSTSRWALAYGVVFMDGYFFVMDIAGKIFNSTLDADPATALTSWVALAFLTAEKENGAGVALTRTLDYVIALKEWSCEPFYNAANTANPGSILAPVDNGYAQIGCASAQSVARVGDAVYWMSKMKEKGRSVHMMHGLDRQKVSTPDIERILNADDLATVYSYGVSMDGHLCYLLTLVTSNITLVYDATVGKWTQWSSYTASGSGSVTSITRSGTTATAVTSGAHGLSDGDPVLIAGANQAEYNGIVQISYISTTSFSYQVTGTPASPATGTITWASYVESYFKFTKYVNAGGRDVFLHASDGHLYEMLPSVYRDSGLPINLFGRSVRLDGGDLGVKKLGNISVVGDKVADVLMVRWSDDDCTTFKAYRYADLSKEDPRIRRNGSFKRRTLEFRHIGNNPIRLSSLELEVSK